MGLTTVQGFAQMHAVKKPETVVRAIGVYEWIGEEAKPAASRLVPVSIFIDGHLEDAGVYLARPVPFALDTGTIFEIEQAGAPQGTVEVENARELVGNDEGDEWIGYAKYSAPPKPKLVPQHGRKTAQLAVNGAIPDEDSDRPVMVRHSGSESTESTADSGQDRPTLSRPAGSGGDASNTGTTGENGTQSSDDAERPTLRKRSEPQLQAARKQKETASVTSAGALTDDPDRPVLRRPEPAEAGGAMLTGTPDGMEQRVAISDAVDRPEHDFARPWETEAERAAVLGKLQEVARARLAAYGNGSKLNTSISGSKVAVKGGGQRAAKTAAAQADAAPAGLTEESLKGYTLSYGGDATYVYTAASPGAAGRRFVTLVAQQEPLGELKVALASVTDEQHLDRTPQLRLVDAVDAEASNRASLLFDLRAQATRQFALYRVIGGEAQQTLITGSMK